MGFWGSFALLQCFYFCSLGEKVMLWCAIDLCGPGNGGKCVCHNSRRPSQRCHFKLFSYSKKEKSCVCFRLTIYCESVQPCDWLCLLQSNFVARQPGLWSGHDNFYPRLGKCLTLVLVVIAFAQMQARSLVKWITCCPWLLVVAVAAGTLVSGSLAFSHSDHFSFPW